MRVSESLLGGVSSLLADEYCGNGTMLIHYPNVGQIYSRTITSKDTHSPRGDLLVIFTDPSDLSEQNADIAQSTLSLLGFMAPSFVYGADLILPASLNADLIEFLRKEYLAQGGEAKEKGDVGQASAVALLGQYSAVSVPEVSLEMSIQQDYQQQTRRMSTQVSERKNNLTMDGRRVERGRRNGGGYFRAVYYFTQLRRREF